MLMKSVVPISMLMLLSLLVLAGCHVSGLDMKVKDATVDPFKYGSCPLVETNGTYDSSTNDLSSPTSVGSLSR